MIVNLLQFIGELFRAFAVRMDPHRACPCDMIGDYPG